MAAAGKDVSKQSAKNVDRLSKAEAAELRREAPNPVWFKPLMFGFMLLGLIWIVVHSGLLLVVAKLIRAPLFFLAVGSQANIGGAASAPVVATAFHSSLAPVGVLLAVLGYALGTYCAYITGLMLRALAGA